MNPNRRSSATIGRAVLCAACLWLLAGCQPPQPGWGDIPATPAAQAYAGPLTGPLDTRLDSRVEERSLRLLGSRVEELAIGEDWESHLEWRDRNDRDMSRLYERIPEPDAPVLYAEFSGGNRTLFVIGVANDEGTRLVVLTALTAPR